MQARVGRFTPLFTEHSAPFPTSHSHRHNTQLNGFVVTRQVETSLPSIILGNTTHKMYNFPGVSWSDLFLLAGCPSCHQTKHIKVCKVTSVTCKLVTIYWM